jgi:hypothetical protein
MVNVRWHTDLSSRLIASFCKVEGPEHAAATSSMIPEARLWWMMVAQGVGGSLQFGHPKLDPSFVAEAGCTRTEAPG